VRPGEGGTPARLRLRVEQLLRGREVPPTEAWAELGPEVPALLIRLLDDPAVARHEALRQRVIATLGQLDVAAAVPRLAEILRDRRETPLTRTFAASALSRMQGAGVVAALGQAITDRDEMVRGEVARALGRTQDPEAVPYLAALLNDPAGHVATTAAAQLRAFERRLGRRLDIPADLLPQEPEAQDLAPRAAPSSPVPEA
jgi:HEAT repeat protein